MDRAYLWIGLAALLAAAILLVSSVRMRSRHARTDSVDMDPVQTREALQAYRRILDASFDLICTADREGRLQLVSAASARLLGYTPEEMIGRRFLDFVHPEDVDRTHEAHQSILAGTQVLEFKNRYVHKDGSIVDLSWSASWSGPAGLGYSVARNVTGRKRAELLRAAQSEVLQMIAGNVALPEVLARICTLIESMEPDSRCSVLLFDAENKCIRTGAAPSLPADYTAAIDGAPIGPVAGSCGTAMWRREVVIVEDIATDPLWVDYRHVALPHGLRACWSTPIFGGDRQLLATFAIYYSKPRRPTQRELDLIDAAVSFASVAIECANADTRLRESRLRLELAQEIAQLGYWEHDLATNRMRVYGEASTILGLPPNAVFDPAEFIERVVEEDRPLLRTAYGTVNRGEDPGPVDFRVRGSNGAVRHVFAQRRVIRDADGNTVRIVGTLQDVTDRWAAEQERQRYLAQLSSLADAARKVNSVLTVEELLQVITDIARDLVDAHVAASSIRLDGTGKAALQSLSVSEKYAAQAGEDRSLSIPALDSGAMQELKPARVPRTSPAEEAADLDTVVMQAGVVTVPLMTAGGRRIGLIRVADRRGGDFTPSDERVLTQLADLASVGFENARLYAELEARVRRRTQELEHSNRELEAFSYSVSHDLRGPLRAIAGFTGLLRERHYDTIDPESQRYLDRIQAGTERMSGLIDDLLALGRVTRAELRREPVDLSSLAETIVARLRERAPRSAKVTIEPGHQVNGDLRLLEIVLENLLDNAWKFTAGRDIAQIHFGAIDQNGEKLFFVRDNGVGFDPAYATNLFGVFQRLHSAADFPGTGVGLATVQRIVQRHGGRIWAEAAVDRGATFYFTLKG